MIKVTIFYPNIEGKKFDMTYYCTKHMPMVKQTMGAACKSMAVDAGLSGVELGSRPTYIAMGHLYFDSVDAFQAAFGPNASKFMGDVPNYTDIEPVIQISEVKM